MQTEYNCCEYLSSRCGGDHGVKFTVDLVKFWLQNGPIFSIAWEADLPGLSAQRMLLVLF